jgi:type IV secretory pathway ATPase VirB11/archaellum biosynthesis ATPase
MTLHNYIRRRSLDDITFAEFDRNPNFISDDILPDVVHAQEAMKTVVLVGWISYVMELQII